MRKLKKITALLLVLAMLLSLTACAGKGKGTLSAEEDKAKLHAVLNDILNNMHPGTTGSTLTSIRIAADLVSWAASSNMSKKEAAEAVMKWIRDLPQEQKDEFKNQMKQVAEGYAQIATDGAKSLLESAGVKGKLADLTDKLKEIVDTVIKSVENA